MRHSFFRIGIFFALLITMGAGTAWGWSYKVYCVPKAIWGADWTEGSNIVKVLWKTDNNSKQFLQQMSKTPYTYEGEYIYEYTIYDLTAEGADKLEYQRYSSEDAYEAYHTVFGSYWGHNGFENKIFRGEWENNNPIMRTFGRDVTIYTIPDYLFKDFKTPYNESIHYPAVCIQMGSGSTWNTVNMTKTSYKYATYPIYKATILIDQNKFWEFQIKYFNKSGDSQVDLYQFNNYEPKTEYAPSYIDDKLYHGYNGSSHDFFSYRYDVALDMQSGGGGSTSIIAIDGSAMPSATMPERAGYAFGGYWTETNGGGTQYYNSDGSSTRNWDSRTITTLYAKWTARHYTVTLEGMEADGGPINVDVKYDAVLRPLENKHTKAHYDLLGYWAARDDQGKDKTEKLIDENGNWIPNVKGYTGKDGEGRPTWRYADSNISLFADWTERAYTIDLVVSPKGAGTIDKGATIEVYYTKASADITATASTGYSFTEWDFSKTGDASDVYSADGYTSISNPISIKAQHKGTLTAKFTANNYNVNLENLDADEKGTENVSVTYNSSANLTKNITIPQKAHYDFGGYYTSSDGGVTLDVQLIDEKGAWIASVDDYTDDAKNWLYTDNLILFADWKEIKHTVAIAVSPADAGVVQVNGANITEVTNVGFATKSDEMTPVANAGWVFKEWQVSSGNLKMDLENYHSDYQKEGTNAMKVNATADEQTLTAVFTYRSSIKGTMNGEDWKIDHFVANIETTGGKVIGYVDIDLPANTSYEFAIYDLQEIQWLKNGSNQVSYMTNGDSYNWSFATDKTYNCGITTAGKGTYRFTWNVTDKTMTVTYPTSYQVNYASSVGGSVTSVVDGDGNAVPNGGYVVGGGSVTYTAAAAFGYTFVGWCGSEEYGETFNTDLSWTNSNVIATQNSFAKFKSTNFVIYRTGDMAEDDRAALDDVESYDGGTISEAIEFRMKVRELDKWYSLSLPFEVNKVCVWDNVDGAYYDIVPYYRPTPGGTFYTGHYIIRKPVTTTDFAIEGFEGRDRWIDPESSDVRPSKDIPYIIQWHDPYFLGKYISFFSPTGQTIPSYFNTGAAPFANDVVNIFGNNTMQSGTVKDAYLLDKDYGPSGAWLREDIGRDRTILPFECFILANTATTTRYRILRRGMEETDTPTALEQISNHQSPMTIRVYTITGVLIGEYNDCSFQDAAHRIATDYNEGIYILRSENESMKLLLGGK